MFKSIFISIVAILLLVTGCSFKGYNFGLNQPSFNKTYADNLTQVSFQRVPRWDKQNFHKSYEIFKKSCKGDIDENFEEACEEIDNYRISDSQKFFETNFVPYIINNDNGTEKGRITGYYESRAFGSVSQTKRFKYPIYATPQTQYSKTLSRRNINKKVINSKIICYVDNRYDRYQLHLQGSGTIYMYSGGVVKLGYDNNNGMAFNGGITEDLKLKVIKKYGIYDRTNAEKFARNFPSQADKVYNQYSRYIFFKEQHRHNSIGSAGVELTPEFSIAIDQRYIPLGAPVMLYTYNDGMDKYINRMMFAHDTGNAIKGHVRADVYYGSGVSAKDMAMGMNNRGNMIILMPLKMHKAIERVQTKDDYLALNEIQKKPIQNIEENELVFEEVHSLQEEEMVVEELLLKDIVEEEESIENDNSSIYDLPNLKPEF